MARKDKAEIEAVAYTHPEAKRANNPEAGNLDVLPKVREQKKKYNWDPREAPQLVWAGKAGLTMAEQKEEMSFEVPVVNLHIHERVAPEAIIRAARREDAQRSLFADPEMDWTKEIQFYQHEVDWSNRMILGDSLQVMTSLLEREGMRGKVQMIYLDPPYGIDYRSNFQPRTDDRDVKDGADDDLTREVEVVQAFRDTWELGVNTYLSYLRDRLLAARELLCDSGSIFVQIGDENVHRVRCVLDEVFGDENFQAEICVTKTTGLGSKKRITSRIDFLLWFAKDSNSIKYRMLHLPKQDPFEAGYTRIETEDGSTRGVTAREQRGDDPMPKGRLFMSGDLTKPGPGSKYDVEFQGRIYNPKARWWGMEKPQLDRLIRSGRAIATENTLRYKRYFADSPVTLITNLWTGIGGAPDPEYVVQTNPEIVKRCILMTTDPGDLVLDPTCGGGTTAFVAEEWGRRWMTCDTSRVALAISRHRLMTGLFDYFKLRHESVGVSGGFRNKPFSVVEPQDVAQNTEIDQICAECQPLIEKALSAINEFRSECNARTKSLIPGTKASPPYREWEVPRGLGAEAEAYLAKEHGVNDAFDTHHLDWGVDSIEELRTAKQLLEAFWAANRSMQERIDASVHKNAQQQELVDQPEIDRRVVRVSGPFTMEAVPNVSEISVDVDEKIFGDALQMQIFEPVQGELAAKNVSAYLGDMIEKLRRTGVVTKGRGRLSFTSLRALDHEIVHAEGELELGSNGEARAVKCAVVFGPQDGSVSELLVREGLRASMPYDAVLFCGYDFSAPAQEFLQSANVPGKQFFMAYIAPDTAMGDLLKDTKSSQLFTMVGEPDVVVYRKDDPSLQGLLDDAKKRAQEDVLKRAESLQPGEVFLELRGVDLYNPVKGEVTSDNGADVHAIFVDHDYDGKSFCICQALFPNKKDSWNKIERALIASIDADAFEALRTQVTLPFKPGERMQVKVVDTRGNAVVKTLR
jgi:adenine-specific DNA-methyltransferase